ncbi:apoptosis-inducing factor 3-like isoform X2 [Lineus longissimus]
MREVDVGPGKALLIKESGQYSAVGHKCTHYGAPLVKGALCNGRVRCPWHGACFSTQTGDIEDFPGLDSIPKFDVRVDPKGQVIIHADKRSLEKFKRVKSMSCHEPEEDRSTILIIGGGPASVTCAETLRQEGYQGRVVIATKEKSHPYDRPLLSKAMDIKVENIQLREKDVFTVYDIEVLTDMEAKSIDSVLRCVVFNDGSCVNFDKLLIATGARPRVTMLPGHDLKNVFQLRSIEDANTIASSSKGKNVVIMGASFIGMEVAAYLAGKAKSVSVVGNHTVPFQMTLGEKIGQVLQRLFVEKGVKIYNESGVTEFCGEDGIITGVVIKSGEKLQADVVVMGIGVVPASDFLSGTGVEMVGPGYVVVDKEMRTNKNNIFAAGDVVQFPLDMCGASKVSIGHWQMAHAHGRTAALNMLDQRVEIHTVPYFWTQVFGKSIRYTGYGGGFDDVIIHGDLEAAIDNLQFVAYYTRGEDVIAVASLNADPIVSQAAEFFNTGKTMIKDDISGEDHKDWIKRLR